VDGVELFGARQRKPFLETLEELLDILFRCLLDLIELDFIVVEGIYNTVG